MTAFARNSVPRSTPRRPRGPPSRGCAQRQPRAMSRLLAASAAIASERLPCTPHEGPLRHLAITFADVVVQQDVGRSRRVRSPVVPIAPETQRAALTWGTRTTRRGARDGQRHHLDEVAVPCTSRPLSFQAKRATRVGRKASWPDVGRVIKSRGGRGADLGEVGAEVGPGLRVLRREVPSRRLPPALTKDAHKRRRIGNSRRRRGTWPTSTPTSPRSAPPSRPRS